MVHRLFVLIALLSLSRGDECIFVSSSGNDQIGNGTMINPYATISAAIQSSSIKLDQTIVCMLPGSYLGEEDLVIDDTIQSITIRGYGTSVIGIGATRLTYNSRNPLYGQLAIEGIQLDDLQMEFNGGMISINGCTFSNQTLAYTGKIHQSRIEILDSKFHSTLEMGGLLSFTADSVRISNCLFSGARAMGEIVATTANVLHIINSTFSSNVVGHSYAAISSTGDIIIAGSSFKNNIQLMPSTNLISLIMSGGDVNISDSSFSCNIRRNASNVDRTNNPPIGSIGKVTSTNIFVDPHCPFYCSDGKYSPSLVQSCRSCNGNSFPSSPNVTQCTKCPKGWIAATYTCEACPQGSYQSGSDCVLCPPGTHQPYGGQAECFTCPDDFDSPQGSVWCVVHREDTAIILISVLFSLMVFASIATAFVFIRRLRIHWKRSDALALDETPLKTVLLDDP